jgi:DNA-binding response OmpR family regulator
MSTLLLVDDSRNIQELCKSQLESEGHRVLLARDGAAAIAMLNNFRADVVILDIHMPRMNGWEALQRISAEHQVPVILHTAEEADCSQHPHRPLASAYVKKSEDLAELKAAVRSALGRATPPAPLILKSPAAACSP